MKIVVALAGMLLVAIVLMSGCIEQPKVVEGENMDNRFAVFETSMGNFKAELFEDKVTQTAGNFIHLAQQGYFDGTRFHRVIDGFMIQGGDPLSKDVSKKDSWGTGGPGYTIPDEFDETLKHDSKGLLSMANAGPNTGGSQFFITVAETPWLDGKHAIFGKVVEGYDVVEKISKTQVGQNDRPVKDVVVNKVKIVEK